MSDDDVIVLDDSPQRKSISCEQIPELFLDKLIAKQHFSQFGRINRFILRPKRFSCTVEYESQQAAEAALARGNVFRDVRFNIYWTDDVPGGGGNGNGNDGNGLGAIDPEVQQELSIMSGGPSSLPQRQTTKAPMTNKQAIESFLKKTERFPNFPVVAPPKPSALRMVPAKLSEPLAPISIAVGSSSSSDPKINQTRSEFEVLARKPAFTAEERYRVLDARDKYVRSITDRTTDIRKVRSTQGTCEDMCPEKERYMRECKFQVASYESGEEGGQQMDHAKAIKQYSRSSADQEAPLALELRSERGLELSMGYLLHKIADKCEDEDVGLGDWFHYVWDRTRSIRKDITQQELCSVRAVRLVEQCARFHIHCAARLIAEEPSVFDQKINTENMTKCLQSLKYMYHDLGLKGVRCPNEAEFRGYVILLNLNDGNFLWEIKQLPKDILKSREVRFALEVYFAVENNNYVRFFRLVEKTTYMNACILLRYFNQVRSRALQTMLRAYTYRNPATFSLEHFCDILAFEDTEAAASFLEAYGLPVNADLGTVLMDPKLFERPEVPFQLERAYQLVESKRTTTVGEVISGEPLIDISLIHDHQLENSFNANGYFREDFLRDLMKQSKQLEPPISPVPLSPATDDDKLFKVPSPTSISPKPLFPKPAISSNQGLFQPSRFGATTSKIEIGAPAPVAPSIFSKSSPSPTLSGITPLSEERTPTPAAAMAATGHGSNMFGYVPFPGVGGAASGNSIFGSFQTPKTEGSSAALAGSIFGISKLQQHGDEQLKLNKQKQEEEQRRQKQLEEEQRELKRKLVEKQEQELRQQREAEEERIRRELIARKQAEIRRLKELEEEGKRQLEATVLKIAERIWTELSDDLIGQDVEQIAEECYYKHQVCEVLPQKNSDAIQEEVLGELVSELVREEMLVRQSLENRQLNIMRKFFKIWRKNAHQVVENRAQIENSPAWLPERGLTELARGCFEKHQTISMADMKRYLGGVSQILKIPERKEEKIDLFDLMRSHMSGGRKKRSESLIKNHVYWKLTISIPFKQEEDSSGFYYFINKWLKDAVNRYIEADGKCLFLEAQESAAARERLVVCLRLLKGVLLLDELNSTDPNAVENSDGLLFFLTPNNVDRSRERLQKILEKADHWGPIPLTVIAYNFSSATDESVEELLDIDSLLEEGKIHDFEIIHHRETEKCPLRTTFAKALAYLASSYNFESTLEMQSQTAFIGTCLGEELWHRLQISANQNSKLLEACQDPNFVIQLYNQAVDRVNNLVQHNFSVYPDFPAEFKPFVSKRRFDIPLDLEYFPKDWRNPERQKKLVKFFNDLKLNPMTSLPQSVRSIQDLKVPLLEYIKKCLPKVSEKNLRRLQALVIQEILKSLPPIVPPMETNLIINWLPPLTILSNEILRNRWGEALPHLPCEIIYHKREFLSYTRSLWWLPELKKIKRNPEPASRDLTVNGSFINDHTHQDDLDGSTSFMEDSASNSTATTFSPKRMKLNISLGKDDLEEVLLRSRRCLERAEEKINRCREFTQQSRDLTGRLDGQLYDQERTFRLNRWQWDANFR
ncbi:germinal-center associated nuclear protein [Uranotaenia lowii]|uniref:germinal-center associated nuclear protein n=1 Tax=Uranotaenia lowii TaxID=190385 RepID=UPI00247B133D|nr:germinal-center associated nuclear protein [Uranotaenia lowii]